jgi:hypothetical protein
MESGFTVSILSAIELLKAKKIRTKAKRERESRREREETVRLRRRGEVRRVSSCVGDQRRCRVLLSSKVCEEGGKRG